jgi:chemotaxis protein CheX
MTTAVVHTEDLLSITAQVWESFLDPEGTSPLLPETGPAPIDILAAVSVTGAWQGHVVVECSTAAARHAAAALLGVDTAEVSEDDVADALGELANIIGGNVKVLLPEPCALSLPYVAAADGARWPSVAEVCRLSGSWQDEPVMVAVLESRAESGGVAA